jgi:hypothetical protein
VAFFIQKEPLHHPEHGKNSCREKTQCGPWMLAHNALESSQLVVDVLERCKHFLVPTAKGEGAYSGKTLYNIFRVSYTQSTLHRVA